MERERSPHGDKTILGTSFTPLHFGKQVLIASRIRRLLTDYHRPLRPCMIMYSLEYLQQCWRHVGCGMYVIGHSERPGRRGTLTTRPQPRQKLRRSKQSLGLQELKKRREKQTTPGRMTEMRAAQRRSMPFSRQMALGCLKLCRRCVRPLPTLLSGHCLKYMAT